MKRIRTLALLASLLSMLAPNKAVAAEEHAVIVYIQMLNPGLGATAELDKLFELEDQFASAIERAGVGEHDGNEVGGGEFTIYCYGPNGDKLFFAIEPILRKSSYSKGARIVVRYGRPGAREVEHKL